MFSTGTRHKPALDENSFQQLLAAAYVVQQHNESLRATHAETPSSQVFTIIAEIQALIRSNALNISDSAALIAERLLELTTASGVSVSLIDNGYLDCVAEAGTPVKIPGSCISSHSLVATEHLKSSQLFESENSQTDLRLDAHLCREAGVGSLVSAPILRFGEIAGLLEVRWARAHAFREAELRTCRLMAGLAGGTLERSVRMDSARNSVASNSPLAAWNGAGELEDSAEPASGVKPSHTPIETPQISSSQVVPIIEPGESAPPAHQLQTSAALHSCRVCGRPFEGDEQFCGFCSMPRPAEKPTEQLQSKWASLWFMQRAQGALLEKQKHSEEQKPLVDTMERARPQREPYLHGMLPVPVTPPRQKPEEEQVRHEAPPATTIVTRESFLDDKPPLSVQTTSIARNRWREVALILAVLTLAVGLATAWPKSADHRTWFQSWMIRSGVMHPKPKIFVGAPETRVWLDVHTQLYYCSGDDLYGKTPDGEFTTQYNAQSDGYVPASNVTCP